MDRKNLIKEMCSKLNISKGKMSDEYLFTLTCMDLFFYNGHIGSKDIQDGFIDGCNDGGIDYIYTNEDIMYDASINV